MKNTIKDFDLDLKTTKNNSYFFLYHFVELENINFSTLDYSSGNFNLYILKNR